MLFDTHCHLNFKAFKNNLDEVIKSAKNNQVELIVIPGTDFETSKKAIEIANKYNGIYGAVGVHPHHVFEIYYKNKTNISLDIKKIIQDLLQPIKELLKDKKVVAIGEVGIDKHYYQKTKHKDYKIDEGFVNIQKEIFIEQIKLAYEYKKSLIIHNREAKKEVLEILTKHKSLIKKYSSVFHCCEADIELLNFAQNNKMFIGVDGDVVYNKEKQEFIKKVPLNMLVLETDSPYLSPLRKFPNEPKNIKYISDFIADLKEINIKEVEEKTTNNAKTLFGIDEK